VLLEYSQLSGSGLLDLELCKTDFCIALVFVSNGVSEHRRLSFSNKGCEINNERLRSLNQRNITWTVLE
jgi:hypothetical protein